MVKPLKKQSPSASVSSIRSTEEIIDQLESVDISDKRADDNARFPECEGISRSAEPEGAWCVYWAPSNERDENNDCYIGPITYSDPTSYGCEPSDFLADLMKHYPLAMTPTSSMALMQVRRSYLSKRRISVVNGRSAYTSTAFTPNLKQERLPRGISRKYRIEGGHNETCLRVLRLE